MFPLSDSIPVRGFPLVNLAIIAGSVFVFLEQIFSSNPDAFVYQYALIPAHVDIANVATLTPFVTAIFLHGGFLHIISNMWFLFIFGDNVEDSFGSIFYLFFYLLSGIVGNALQYMLMPNSEVPIIGASGAIAGALGAYYVLFPFAKIKTFVLFFGFITLLDISAPLMLGYWFVLQLLSGAVALPFTSSATGGIAFWAHVGGFLTGVIIATLLKARNSVGKTEG
jgi:membrane associated rhomboid family serine protease